MKLLSVVVPVYNEIECLPLFMERVSQVAPLLKDIELELLFVDDGSTDGSYQWLSEASKRDARVRVIKFSRNFGSYIALTAGLRECAGDAAIMLSADLQDPPELLPELLDKWRGGADVVWAVRRSREGDALWRRISSGVFYTVFRKIAFPNYPPKGYDFCLISRQVIDVVVDGLERNTSIFALIVWANFESAAIPYDRGARARGHSHWNLRKMLRLAIDSIISFSVLPVRISLWLSVITAFLLIAYLAAILYGKFWGGWQFPPGWPSTMAVILLTSGLQFLILSVLGEYLWRTLDQTRGRPLYVISKKLGLNRRRDDKRPG